MSKGASAFLVPSPVSTLLLSKFTSRALSRRLYMLLKLSTLLIICGAAASALAQLEYGSSLLRRQAIVNCDDAPFNYPGDPIGSGVQDFDCAQQFVFNNLTFYENCRPQCDAFRALFTDGCQTTAPAFVGCFCSSSAVNIFSTCAQCVNSTAVIQSQSNLNSGEFSR